MKKSKIYTTCRKCGKTYHYGNDLCPHCELIPYWYEMAEYYKREAQRCIETAQSLEAEKARELANGTA